MSKPHDQDTVIVCGPASLGKATYSVPACFGMLRTRSSPRDLRPQSTLFTNNHCQPNRCVGKLWLVGQRAGSYPRSDGRKRILRHRGGCRCGYNDSLLGFAAALSSIQAVQVVPAVPFTIGLGLLTLSA